MKWIARILLIIVAGFVAFVVWYRWDSGTNHGFSFGYFGEFNTVSNALASIPGVTVVDAGGNQDVVFEEFHFRIREGDGEPFPVWFGEDDPIRNMSGAELTDALKRRIKQESSNKTN